MFTRLKCEMSWNLNEKYDVSSTNLMAHIGNRLMIGFMERMMSSRSVEGFKCPTLFFTFKSKFFPKRMVYIFFILQK